MHNIWLFYAEPDSYIHMYIYIQLYQKNFWVLGMIFYFGFACMITMLRGTVRRTYSLMGDLFRDLLASFVWYPFALIQVSQSVACFVCLVPMCAVTYILNVCSKLAFL
jgi:hypothetical protein